MAIMVIIANANYCNQKEIAEVEQLLRQLANIHATTCMYVYMQIIKIALAAYTCT